MKKPSIPDIPAGDPATRVVLQALKENIEILEGRRGGDKIVTLASTATLAQVITKLNEVINHLQN